MIRSFIPADDAPVQDGQLIPSWELPSLTPGGATLIYPVMPRQQVKIKAFTRKVRAMRAARPGSADPIAFMLRAIEMVAGTSGFAIQPGLAVLMDRYRPNDPLLALSAAVKKFLNIVTLTPANNHQPDPYADWMEVMRTPVGHAALADVAFQYASMEYHVDLAALHAALAGLDAVPDGLPLDDVRQPTITNVSGLVRDCVNFLRDHLPPMQTASTLDLIFDVSTHNRYRYQYRS